MAVDTEIQWCDSTINPTMGCDGCELWNPINGVKTCYAGLLHDRYGSSNKGYSPTFDKLTVWPGRMEKSSGWPDLAGRDRVTKPWLNGLPRLIFVSDMSDAFSAGVTFEYLRSEVITAATSELGRRHRYLWLTKRPQIEVDPNCWTVGGLVYGVAPLGGGPRDPYQGSRAATRRFTGCVPFDVPSF